MSKRSHSTSCDENQTSTIIIDVMPRAMVFNGTIYHADPDGLPALDKPYSCILKYSCKASIASPTTTTNSPRGGVWWFSRQDNRITILPNETDLSMYGDICGQKKMDEKETNDDDDLVLKLFTDIASSTEFDFFTMSDSLANNNSCLSSVHPIILALLPNWPSPQFKSIILRYNGSDLLELMNSSVEKLQTLKGDQAAKEEYINRWRNDISKILLQVCKHILILHGLGIPHGDLKLENVVVKEEEANALCGNYFDVRLIDFECTSGESLGTISKWSPKRHRDRRHLPTFQDDLWCIGQMIYELALLRGFERYMATPMFLTRTMRQFSSLLKNYYHWPEDTISVYENMFMMATEQHHSLSKADVQYRLETFVQVLSLLVDDANNNTSSSDKLDFVLPAAAAAAAEIK